MLHTHTQKVILGISGGLDSTLALLACVRAFDKLGYERSGIIGVTMPGFGTTDRTYNNALKLMGHLGVTIKEINIAKDRKSTRLNSSHANISYAVFCLKKKKNKKYH